MPSETVNTLEASQEQSFLDLVQQKHPALVLNRARPIGILLPARANSEPIEALHEHVLPFNIHKVPTLIEIRDYSTELNDKKFDYMTAQIIYPDQSVSTPMGLYVTDENDSFSSDAKRSMANALIVHARRADGLTIPTATAFDDAWKADSFKARQSKNKID